MKHRTGILLAFVVVFGGLFFSCGKRTQSKALSSQNSDEPFVEFLQFHERFLADSAFQLEHILFPLEGLPANADSTALATGNFRWTEENWEIHRAVDLKNSGYEQQFIPFDDQLIVERIVHESGGYASERRFAKIEGNWYLIYFAGLNAMK